MSDAIESIIAGLGRSRGPDTRKRAVLELKKSWVAERMAPTLLPYAQDTIDAVMAQIRALIAVIEESSLLLNDGEVQTTSFDGENIKLRLLVVETELERAKFVARGYLRARLAKIDKYAIYWNMQPAGETPLSLQEQQYLQRRLMVKEKLYDSSFLLALPSDLQDLAETDGAVSMVDVPDLDKPVAVRVTKSGLDPVEVGSEDVLLEKDGLYMLRYSAIAALPVELV